MVQTVFMNIKTERLLQEGAVYRNSCGICIIHYKFVVKCSAKC